jgi:hypothetical protein
MPTEKNPAFLPMQQGFKLDWQRVKQAGGFTTQPEMSELCFHMCHHEKNRKYIVLLLLQDHMLPFPHYLTFRPGFISNYDLLSWEIFCDAVVGDRKV